MKKNKKHFLLFYNEGKLTIEKPRKWAKKNKKIFSNFSFQDNNENHPTTNFIENVLISKFNFKCLSNEDIVVCYNIVNK
jgi:hypothetical protein